MKLSQPIYQLKRKAKSLARTDAIPLHQALDRIAQDEGFSAWSLLSSRHETSAPSMLSQLSDGDLLLIAARPGHGKTLVGLQLLLDAVREARRASFFTLEYTNEQTIKRIHTLPEGKALGDRIEIVTSDEISADYIMLHLAGVPKRTVAVIDYLQILDQQRSKPSLSEQVSALHTFARNTGTVLAFISQIDRSFEAGGKNLPDLQDVRLPNELDLGLFTKACFLHDREVRLQHVA
ncbi:replicative DNA helicase [Rhizobium sp. BK650]|uniref:DNA helicase n=1 Tax=Rhizobium sp. BK650 TaxID=2586990 RepID=UPI00160FF2C4|nr:DNA helicase [Rhizobium sp. BK650]MBB3656883.1 replicative DNA helicase [Rhizobium sp. BK650]